MAAYRAPYPENKARILDLQSYQKGRDLMDMSTGRPQKRLKKADFLTDKDFEELTYYEVLDKVEHDISVINEEAADGQTSSTLMKYMTNLMPAFLTLCGLELAEVEPEQPEQEEPEPLPDNFIKEENGWGLCPTCRKKMIKLTASTALADFPAYCKACKAEYLVSWWNVEDKDMEYRRYVNTRSYISRKDIRSEGMKGIGVKGFLRTRTSATERVAMHL